METLLIRERYKVIRALDAREDYACLEAVDIQDREKPACLLNVYEGALLPRYLDCFDRLEDCPAFRGMFVAGEGLVAVFDQCRGPSIDQVFFRGDSHPWQERLVWADRVLHKALELSNWPPELSCAAFLSPNLLVKRKEERVELRMQLSPLEGMNGRELVYLASDQLAKILPPRLGAPEEELRFVDGAAGGRYRSPAELYSGWKEARQAIQAAYEAMEKQNFIRRWLSQLWRWVRWKRRKGAEP